ncbi:hypothetical protein OIDMADRAFT_18318 [Oidiodendron maius Zn]|uniref:CFEM domain-containing protein n=1 Tax=Oidiodendron maius (strain Zn) TaxID=913774 RepID=A0A0C3CTW8_OIDMZ|nr:hypothetical protein OIDMADRAFT_18318 [Oidiodendron maius Zn]
MKTATLTLAVALATGAVAQLGTLPSCATTCLTQYTTGGQIAGCNKIDIKCICSNKDFLSGIACCLASSCSPADQEAAVQYAESLCSTNGVTNLPPSVTCDSTASSTPTSAASSSSQSSSTEATTTNASATSTGTTAATTSPGVTAASTSASSSTGAASSSSSASASPTSTNVAALNVAGLGAGLVGGLAAVAAFL